MSPDEHDSAPDGELSGGRRTVGLQTGRMEAFSDGVFAIAITLLVLEISIPSDRGSDLLRAVLEAWPSYLAYLISFLTIGSVWMVHSAITDLLDRVDPILLRLNLILLLVVGFLPVPTKLLAEYLQSPDGERVAVTLYGLALLATRLMVMALWKYGVSRGLVRPDLNTENVQAVTRKLTPSLAAYVVAISVGLVLPNVAVALYLLAALYLVIPFRLRGRHGPAPASP
ncbi:MAG TPA: TMEM175 family protein [Acidimicrobiia bacterium]|nr:TMEM175 family protein [Acidimicrobiia bacterium]